ncbi:hypothetical protein HPB49_002111 [Dermacentor silvarum]|uniref:Uncharacterized protein n=1 Tax=Dermacentor silvarum TaxID=543639 RepID=A0ACB8DLY8_DERSI|nr:hypothetical protein HPB49_002111 [Dermacentor silvarum]
MSMWKFQPQMTRKSSSQQISEGSAENVRDFIKVPTRVLEVLNSSGPGNLDEADIIFKKDAQYSYSNFLHVTWQQLCEAWYLDASSGELKEGTSRGQHSGHVPSQRPQEADSGFMPNVRGGPDIMQADGTYSGYYTQFTGKGRWLTFTETTRSDMAPEGRVSNTTPNLRSLCRGSNSVTMKHAEGWSDPSTEVPIHLFQPGPGNYTPRETLSAASEPTPPFQRVAAGVSFKVTKQLQQTDIPPGRIRDLKAVDGRVWIEEMRFVTLTWTWPGAHMTHGIGPDIMEDDRTYSGYFTQFSGKGTYSVVAYVYGDNKIRHAHRRPGFQQDPKLTVGTENDTEGPDIMQADGTYSGYFTRFSGKGTYSVVAYVYGDNKIRHAHRRTGFPHDSQLTVGTENDTEGPDIMQADGTYSGYYTQFSGKGTYSVVAYVYDDNKIRHAHRRPGFQQDPQLTVGTENDTEAISSVSSITTVGVEIRGNTNHDDLLTQFESQEVMSSIIEGHSRPPAGSKHVVTMGIPRRFVMTPSGDIDLKLKAYLAARVRNTGGHSIIVGYYNSSYAAESATTAAATTTPARLRTDTGPAATPTPAGNDPALDPASAPTEDVDDDSENRDSSVLIWILQAAI